MFAIALALTVATQQGSDSVVAKAKASIAPLKDSISLHKAGYYAIGFGGGVRDLSPFQGQHWLAVARFMVNPPVDVANPMFMMYLPVGDSLIPVGVAYTQRIARDLPLPTQIGGVESEWHSHVMCQRIPGEGQALADGPDDCTDRGGTAAANQIAMVHTWTIANPDGPYAHDNPSLPFIATGITPPAHGTQDDRLFGIALGETYGAELQVAHRIDIDARRSGTRDALETKRAALRDLVKPLRDADKAGDKKTFEDLRKKMLAAWAVLADQYRASAATPEIKARFDLELSQSTGAMAHHHM